MNFIGIGPAELVVILIVALIFVGPQRLPKLAADLARTIREIRKYTAGVTSEFTDVIREFERETESERNQWREIGEGLSGATRSVTDEVQAARSDAEGKGQSAARPTEPDNGHRPSEPAWQEIPEPELKPQIASPEDASATTPKAEERA